MKSWILILSYLWKNTSQRWLENLISPLSKVLVPFLLALLSCLVLIFFSTLEQELEKQLKNQDSYSVRVIVKSSMDPSKSYYQQSLAEQAMWQSKYGRDAVRIIRQPQHSARVPGSRIPVSIIEYNVDDHSERDAPVPWILYKDSPPFSQSSEMTIGKTVITVYSGELPQHISKTLNTKKTLALPTALAIPMLEKGFTTYISAHLDNLSEVKIFISEAEAYYAAQGRRVSVSSALGLLSEIERFTQMQKYLRVGIVLACGFIISIILGTIALLEFRQESYLIALLRTFGAPSLTLLIHTFMENVLLVGIGILGALKFSSILFSKLITLLPMADVNIDNQYVISEMDIFIICSAAAIGVLLAMIPVAIGLRKPAGLILQ